MHALAPLATTLKMDVDAVELVGEGDPTTALSEVIHYFKDFPVHLSTHYLVGDSHSLILDHVKETGSDLLVMGAYDDSIGESLALGSTRLLDSQQSGADVYTQLVGRHSQSILVSETTCAMRWRERQAGMPIPHLSI
jgi:hypothetical protein